MFSTIKNLWNGFWSLFILLMGFYSVQDVYLTIRKEAAGKVIKGIPPLMKFNDRLWGRPNTYNYKK